MLGDLLIDWLVDRLMNIRQRRMVRMVQEELSEFDLYKYHDEDVLDGVRDCSPDAPHDVIYDAIRRRSAMRQEWPDVIGS